MASLRLLFFIEGDQILRLCAHVEHQGVQKRDGNHGFHHHNGSGNNDGVMSALDLYGDVLSLFVHGLLRTEDGGRGLDMRADQ